MSKWFIEKETSITHCTGSRTYVNFTIIFRKVFSSKMDDTRVIRFCAQSDSTIDSAICAAKNVQQF